MLILLVSGTPCHAQYKRYHGDGVDNVLQFTPLAASVVLKAAGVQGRSTWQEYACKAGASLVLYAGTTYLLKHTVHEMRPDGTDNRSFPSGHTALAFCGATVLHKEYGSVSPWISVAGYAAATATAVDRVRRNRHHWGDVAAGAAIGFLSAEAGYWAIGKICGKRKRQAGGTAQPEETKVRLGVAPDGLAMAVRL